MPTREESRYERFLSGEKLLGESGAQLGDAIALGGDQLLEASLAFGDDGARRHHCCKLARSR